MRRIQATLPTLGTIPVDFHSESTEVLAFLGDRELARLRQVPHLGVAASVFTGVNHSRLEYTLLQCAVIGLVAKLHKGHELLALSSKVKLSGIPRHISSGEELLKVWALLSNCGHAQYTYGVERPVLQLARRSATFCSWLVDDIRQTDLRKWARQIITEYRDGHAHFLLALRRIRYLPSGDRRKAKLCHYVRNLVLPVGDLFPGDFAAQYKVERLRFLYGRIRLLSMVTLDSYYSHHPVRLQLNAAVANLSELTTVTGDDNGFERILEFAAGWLANELYLHPSAVATQRHYEVRAERLLPLRFDRALRRRGGEAHFLKSIMSSGLGAPAIGGFKHLVRLTFDSPRVALLGRRDLCDTLSNLQGELAEPPFTYASVDRNPFTGEVHIDLLFQAGHAGPSDIANVYVKLGAWLVRQLEATALERVRRMFPVGLRENDEVIAKFRDRQFARRLGAEGPLLAELFYSVLRYLLPVDRHASASEVMPGRRDDIPIGVRLVDSRGVVFDQVTPKLAEHLEANPKGLTPDRLQEIRGLIHLVSSCTAPIVLACSEKFLVRDDLGRVVVEWDGVVVELGRSSVVVRILEAKNVGGSVRNANEAFKQLLGTKRLLMARHRMSMRRRRFRGLGAVLTCTIPTDDRHPATASEGLPPLHLL